MRKKGFCFKQAVSLLLAAAMILTAAPQTGMTAFATENSDTSVDSQLLSVDDTLADAGSNDNDTGSDTAQPEDGDNETQLPEELGDGSENDGDVLPEDSGQEGKPDDAEDPGEVTEPADEQEGDGEDAEDIVGEEESVSENTLAAELMVDDDTEDPKESSSEYLGKDITVTDDGRGGSYTALEIGAFESMELNNDQPWTDAQILEKLNKWKDGTKRFDCVKLWINDTGAASRVIKKDLVNAAVELLNEQNGDTFRGIDYIFQKKESGENMNFTLANPGTVSGDINANVIVTPVPGQGVKLKIPAVDFNADPVTVNFGSLANWADIQKCLEGADGEWEYSPYHLFMLKSGQPEMYEDHICYHADCDMGDKRFWLCNLRWLKANTEYLMVPLKNAPSMNAGDTRELTPPAGATNVTWKSYTPDIISINTTSGKTELAAWEQGEALYGVSYKEGGTQKKQFYRMQVEKELARIDFLEKKIEMEVGNEEYLEVVYYPSDMGMDSGDLVWTMEPSEGTGSIIEFVKESGNDNEEKMRGKIIAKNPGTVTVKATYQKNTEAAHADEPSQDDPFTAVCKVTVKGKRLEWEDVGDEIESMRLYAVVGCDTKLGDVTFPTTESGITWRWRDPELSLAPYAGSEGHDFAAICEKDGRSGEHTIWVDMVRVTGFHMQSRMPKPAEEENSQENTTDTWTEWNPWWLPTALEKGDELSLGFGYDLEGIRWDDDAGSFDSVQTAAVEAKLAEKYKVEWSSSPNNLGTQKDDGTYEYTAAVSNSKNKSEKKTFTVSLKDKETNKVVWKASHTLTVTPNPLFGDENWDLINEAWENKELDFDKETGKLTGMTLKIKMSKQDYDKWKLKFESLDTGILQLNTKNIKAEESASGETKTTVVTIPCTQKSFGRVWIKVTAQDDDKSSQTYDINLEDKTPTLLGAATQTINKASSVKSVPIYVSTSEGFPLAKANNIPVVSIQEVKISGKAADVFELTDIHEVKDEEAEAILNEEGSTEEGGDSGPQSYIGVYGMNLGLKSEGLSGVKTGSYTVKLKFKTTAIWDDNKEEEQTASLTVKVTDVKPKVTFKQVGKVNLFYTDDEGAGALQINTGETITSVVLKNYEDKNPSKNANCHYTVRPKMQPQYDENGEVKVENNNVVYEEVRDNNGNVVYEIVKKTDTQLDGSLKKGTLEYTVDGYEGTFKTTFTVGTENKAPAIVLSTKSDTLYPGVGYSDSWISVTDKATGEPVVPTKATYYVGKGATKTETELVIGNFDDSNSDTQKAKEKEITGSASGNKYGLFVDTDKDENNDITGLNIVSRFRESTNAKNSKKADTINLELKEANWSKPVAVSYKLQVNTETPKLALGKATLTLNKNDAVYRGQQERTTLRLKGLFNGLVRYKDSQISITGQDEKSKAELKGKDSSLVVQYWDNVGDVIVRLNDNDIAPGNYKVKISVGKDGEHGYTASTVLTVKIVNKTVKQSLKVTAKGSIDVLNREGTYITYTPKISNLTGTVESGWLEGKDANLFETSFEDGKLIVKADPWRTYSTKITYEVHTVFWVQTEDWRGYKISSDNDTTAKPFKIKVKQGKPKLTAKAVDGNILYRQRGNSVAFRVSAMLGKQDVAIQEVSLPGYWNDLWRYYDSENQTFVVGFNDSPYGEIRKNGTYKLKLTVRYSDKAGDVKDAQITCPIVVR